MTNQSGATTWFRGETSAVTERHELVLTFSLAAGDTVYKGQGLSIDNDVNQETSPTAGTNAFGDTNGVVKTMTADTVQMIGICLNNVDDSDTTANEYGKRSVSVLMKGITLMRCIVNATGTSDGYEKPIKVGDPAMIGGDNCSVTGFTALTAGAYAIAIARTDGSGNTQIGWFLDSQDGHTTSQTISNNSTTISASQAEDPSTWVRVYVDIFLANGVGITTATLAV